MVVFSRLPFTIQSYPASLGERINYCAGLNYKSLTPPEVALDVDLIFSNGLQKCGGVVSVVLLAVNIMHCLINRQVVFSFDREAVLSDTARRGSVAVTSKR